MDEENKILELRPKPLRISSYGTRSELGPSLWEVIIAMCLIFAFSGIIVGALEYFRK